MRDVTDQRQEQWNLWGHLLKHFCKLFNSLENLANIDLRERLKKAYRWIIRKKSDWFDPQNRKKKWRNCRSPFDGLLEIENLETGAWFSVDFSIFPFSNHLALAISHQQNRGKIIFRGNVIEFSNYRVIFVDLGIFLALN